MEPYRFVAEEYHLPGVITGFEPVDVLQGIYMLLKQLEEGRAEIEIGYHRGVSDEGNPTAWALVEQYFSRSTPTGAASASFPGTGLGLRPEYDAYNAVVKLPVTPPPAKADQGLPVRRGPARHHRALRVQALREGVHAGASDWSVHGLLGRQLRGLLPLHRLREGISPCAQTGFSSPTVRAAR